MKTQKTEGIQVDIVSDVVCPWCIVGFLQLDQALTELNMKATVRWHPFELNPTMAPEGENIREHIMGKYGVSEEQSKTARAQLVALGSELGFQFTYSDESRIVNTFKAHQLLDWAVAFHLQHPLKLALFNAYFTEARDVSDTNVLLDVVQSVGLDRDAAAIVLDTNSHSEQTREKQQFWTSRGISGVPAMIFSEKYLITGAQGVDGYVRMLERCRAEAA